jgi:hypothetical protein
MAKIQRRERDQSSADRCSKVMFLRFAVIKELLSTAGHDFTSRSDSNKVALRFASKAKPEELTRLYRQVEAEDKRFRPMNSSEPGPIDQERGKR